eukprot:IDg4345t1
MTSSKNSKQKHNQQSQKTLPVARKAGKGAGGSARRKPPTRKASNSAGGSALPKPPPRKSDKGAGSALRKPAKRKAGNGAGSAPPKPAARDVRNGGTIAMNPSAHNVNNVAVRGPPVREACKAMANMNALLIKVRSLTAQRDFLKKDVAQLALDSVKLKTELARIGMEHKRVVNKWARMTSKRGQKAAGCSDGPSAFCNVTHAQEVPAVELESRYISTKIKEVTAERDTLRSVLMGQDSRGAASHADEKLDNQLDVIVID